MGIYDFIIKDMKGNDISLSEYKGKVLLIVNTATKCGFTPQYDELQKLYDKYKDQNFDIIDFPCNQFNEQAPEDNEEIHKFCTGRFGIKFKQFAKIDVNGENEDKLYTYLKKEMPTPNFGKGAKAALMKKTFKALNKTKNSSDVQWNFTKFLIDKNGKVVNRFEPTYNIDLIEKEIVELLK